MFSFSEPSPITPPTMPPVGGAVFGDGGQPLPGVRNDDVGGGRERFSDEDVGDDDDASGSSVVPSIRKRSPSTTPLTAEEVGRLFSEQAPLDEHRLYGDGRPPVDLDVVHLSGFNTGGPTYSSSALRGSVAGSPPSNSGDIVGGNGSSGNHQISNNPSMYSAVSDMRSRGGSMQRLYGAKTNKSTLGANGVGSARLGKGGIKAVELTQQEFAIHALLDEQDFLRQQKSPHTSSSPSAQLYHHHSNTTTNNNRTNLSHNTNSRSVFYVHPAPAPLPFPSMSPQLYPTIDAIVEEIIRSVESLERIPLWDSQKMPHSELTSTLQHLRSLRVGWRESMEKKLGVLWLHVSETYGAYCSQMDAALRRRHAMELEAAFGFTGSTSLLHPPATPTAITQQPTVASGSTFSGAAVPTGILIHSGTSTKAGDAVVPPQRRTVTINPSALGASTQWERRILAHLASVGVRCVGGVGSSSDCQAKVPGSFFGPPLSKQQTPPFAFQTPPTTSNGFEFDVTAPTTIPSSGNGVSRKPSATTRRTTDNNNRRRSDLPNLSEIDPSGYLDGMANGGGSGSAPSSAVVPPGHVRLTCGKVVAVGNITAYGDIAESHAHDARIKQREQAEERRRLEEGEYEESNPGKSSKREPAYNPKSPTLREAMGLPPLEGTAAGKEAAKRPFRGNTSSEAALLAAAASVRTPAMFKPTTSNAIAATTGKNSSSNGVDLETATFPKLTLLVTKQMRERERFEVVSQNHFAQLAAAKAYDTHLLQTKMSAAEDTLESLCEVVDNKVAAALLLARTNGNPSAANLPPTMAPSPTFLQRQASAHIAKTANNARRAAQQQGGGTMAPTKPKDSAPLTKKGSNHAASTSKASKQYDTAGATSGRAVGGLGEVVQHSVPHDELPHQQTPPRTAPGGARHTTQQPQPHGDNIKPETQAARNDANLNDTARP